MDDALIDKDLALASDFMEQMRRLTINLATATLSRLSDSIDPDQVIESSATLLFLRAVACRSTAPTRAHARCLVGSPNTKSGTLS